MKWLLGALAVVAAASAAGAWSYAMGQLEPADANAATSFFQVESGSGMKRIARGLEHGGIVRDARATEWYARLSGLDASIQAGEYELSPAWSTRRVLEQLTSGRVRTYAVVIPEGIRATEIAERLEQAGVAKADEFMALASDANFAHSLGLEAEGLEGYLYPETYQIPRDLQTARVARVLVDQFTRAWAELEGLAKQRGLSQHEVVTLASIVEKERPLIAAVFLNRLKRGMRLETDPTVIYGVADFNGNLRRVHLNDASNPYNTYKIPGLPPGPIASPGADALRAVLEPAESDFLFFVSKKDGTHHFSKTYREHVNAVNRYQLRRRSK
jgi:UPF0755 protein